MSQLVHAVSRVRAMESQLLTSNAVERMISAESFDSAYSVLDNLGYAEESSYFRETKDFEGVLEMGLYSSRQTFSSFGLESLFRICTVILDIQNISLALKSKEKNEDGDDLENMMIPYGYYSIEDIKKVVFENIGNSELLSLFSTLSFFKTLEEKEQKIHSFLFEKAKNEADGNLFLLQFLSYLENSELLKLDILEKNERELSELYPQFSVILQKVFLNKTQGGQISAFEILFDEKMVQFLKESSLGKIDGIEPLFSFFWRKERNARVIRSILLAKKAAISSEEIRKEFTSFIF